MWILLMSLSMDDIFIKSFYLVITLNLLRMMVKMRINLLVHIVRIGVLSLIARMIALLLHPVLDVALVCL
jgi:hypothetical protein